MTSIWSKILPPDGFNSFSVPPASLLRKYNDGALRVIDIPSSLTHAHARTLTHTHAHSPCRLRMYHLSLFSAMNKFTWCRMRTGHRFSFTLRINFPNWSYVSHPHRLRFVVISDLLWFCRGCYWWLSKHGYLYYTVYPRHYCVGLL